MTPTNFFPYIPIYYNSVLMLVRQLQEHEHALDSQKSNSPENAKKYLDEIIEKVKRHAGNIILAQKGGEIVGMASWYQEDELEYDEPYGYLSDIVVTKSQRGQGIGKNLVNQVVADMKNHGLKRVHVGVMENNLSANKLYKQCSFRAYASELIKDIQ